MSRRPRRSTRTDLLVPDTTLVRSNPSEEYELIEIHGVAVLESKAFGRASSRRRHACIGLLTNSKSVSLDSRVRPGRPAAEGRKIRALSHPQIGGAPACTPRH